MGLGILADPSLLLHIQTSCSGATTLCIRAMMNLCMNFYIQLALGGAFLSSGLRLTQQTHEFPWCAFLESVSERSRSAIWYVGFMLSHEVNLTRATVSTDSSNLRDPLVPDLPHNTTLKMTLWVTLDIDQHRSHECDSCIHHGRHKAFYVWSKLSRGPKSSDAIHICSVVKAK
jgi:hypothetical protein